MSHSVRHSDPSERRILREVVGYLNFSEGTSDPAFLNNLSKLYRGIGADGERLVTIQNALRETLAYLEKEGGAFRDVTQARAVLSLTFERFLPAYREFHHDLLWSRDPDELWAPFFLGRMIEAVLAQGPPWTDADRIVQDARDRLDDYLGYRPVAVLEGEQRIEPYRHEWIRPIPLFIESVGVAHGPYEDLIKRTLAILHELDPALGREAWFDLELMEELAFDPRAYDFDHPANKRPNYHFGHWDPNRIDQRGFFRRFVVQPITLDALLARVESASQNQASLGFDREELMFEASVVLAGTMLMASGTSGDGPGRHGSEVTLSTLLPHIVSYRDRYYQQLLELAGGSHGERLREEAQQMHQPFGAARQHLNQELARRRATQLQHVHLAQVFARMGYRDAAKQQAQTVQVASARMLSQIYCRLTDGHHAIDNRRFDAVARLLPEIDDLLHRGIECGALVDPWNVVGFGGNFSLFPAPENSVHDYRVDDLIRLVEQILDLASRASTEAAAVDDTHHEEIFSRTLAKISDWWDQYATASVSGVPWLVGKEIEISTNLVAGALHAWQKADAAAGDIGFWRMFVDQFDTPKAFQLVIEALLDKQDLVASMALMMQWVSQAELTPLEGGDASFHPLATRWFQSVEARQRETGEDQWPLVAKFFESLEANAEDYWHVPTFLFGESWNQEDQTEEPLDDLLDLDDYEDDGFQDDSDEDDLDNLFNAAYDDVVFRDSADDGGDSSIFSGGDDETQYELEEEAERIQLRLNFLMTVARLWKHTAIVWSNFRGEKGDRREALVQWESEATARYAQLGALLEAVHNHRIPEPRGTHEAMVEYDRRRVVKDGLLEETITTCVEMSDAGRLLRAAAGKRALPDKENAPTRELARTIEIIRAVLTGDSEAVALHWRSFCQSLVKEELLYIPLGRGGMPGRIVKARALHQLIYDLLDWLPRIGLVRETCHLLDVAQRMEVDHPIGPGAVTEYDRLFENGYKAIVRCFIASAEHWDEGPSRENQPRRSDELLVQALQDLTESQVKRWLRHSSTVRLSVVEKFDAEKSWDRFVHFVERYGADLFDQRFLSLSNLRAILHQGVSTWLSNLEQEPDSHDLLLVDELGGALPHDDASELLTTALEAVVENYREYRDYNSTTTQSDQGDLLYIFVDFIRLRSSYDRIAWNLKPVFLAHNILVRQDRLVAADLWRQLVAERSAEEAEHFTHRYAELCEHYGMRLPSIAERLAERFIRPLVIDRLRGFARPAMKAAESTEGRVSPVFAAMQDEISSLMQEPSGAGLDVPDWITAIEEEVTEVRQQRRRQMVSDDAWRWLGQSQLSWEDLQEQLREEIPE